MVYCGCDLSMIIYAKVSSHSGTPTNRISVLHYRIFSTDKVRLRVTDNVKWASDRYVGLSSTPTSAKKRPGKVAQYEMSRGEVAKRPRHATHI